MKTYLINETSTEKIEFRANESSFALVQFNKLSKEAKDFYKLKENPYKTIILNQREMLNLYQAIQDSVLNKKT